MILVDTSVWVDHLRSGDRKLAEYLDRGHVLAHPFVIGELALGVLRDRDGILWNLRSLPQASVAADLEILDFIERHQIAGRGIGYVDVHLLAALRLTSDAFLWTRDKRLNVVAEQMNLAAVV